MKIINIAITDQHQIIRTGLKGLLSKNQSLNVSLVATSPKELVQLIKTSQNKLDVIIIDYNLAKKNNFVASGKFQKVLPKCKIILLTDTETESLIQKEIPNHAHGFISKSYETKFLEKYIQKIYEEETFNI